MLTDKGPRINLVTTFFAEEEEREVDFSRPGSPVSRRSPSLSLRSFMCFDLGFTRPDLEEPEPTKDSEMDLRRDSRILIE
jgi:hypothetical protein